MNMGVIQMPQFECILHINRCELVHVLDGGKCMWQTFVVVQIDVSTKQILCLKWERTLWISDLE